MGIFCGKRMEGIPVIVLEALLCGTEEVQSY